MASPLVDERSPLQPKIHEQRYAINGRQFLTGISDFDAASENPLNWQPRFKWGIVALLSFTSFTVTFTCMATIHLMRHIARDLDGIQAPPSAAVLPVTIWELGEAVGPLLIGPLSEMTGRYAVMNVTNSIFIVTTALTALSQTMPLFIASRAVTGLTVASNVLNPAIIGDMFAPEQRGTAMSLVMFAPLLGSSVGPVLGGFLLPTLGWRCVVWVSVALATICELAFYTFFRETYSVVILRRRTRKQVTRTTNDFDQPSATWRFRKGSAELWSSMRRPASVLFSSGLLSAVAVFGAIIFSQSYVLSVTFPIILEDTYGLSPTAVGSAFLAQGIGTLIGLLICKFGLDRVYMSLREANDGIGQPEYRLPMAIIGSFMLPPATALYDMQFLSARGWMRCSRLFTHGLPKLIVKARKEYFHAREEYFHARAICTATPTTTSSSTSSSSLTGRMAKAPTPPSAAKKEVETEIGLHEMTQ